MRCWWKTIGTLQSGANEAASVMESSRELARTTVDKTSDAESALVRIREEVNRNISRIHDATVETSAGSDQVASASRDLAVLAGQLRSRVSVFRLSNR